MSRNLLLIGLIDFTNSNFAKNLNDWKLVISYCFFLNKVVVSWYDKKQRIILTLTTETEYNIFGHVIKKAVWIQRFINQISLDITTIVSIIIYNNNEINIALTKNVEN